MDKRFEGTGFCPADILLPRGGDMEKWAVVACDQFTSEPEYWEKAEAVAGDAPSALRLVLPEVYLGGGDVDARIAAINDAMERYLAEGVFRELPDSLISKFKAEVSNPSLQAYVLNQQGIYEEISHKAIEYPESLMPNEPLAEITDGEQLFRKIIEPYKGKVVYLDVWGTWCGPCKDMMQYAGSAKKLFEGKDVIFLYLCNHSSDKSWKNIIKEYGLTGKIAVHYNLPDEQQRAIEKFLQVRSFPTYMLIDKEGNIVNRDAPRPNRENDLLNAVYKLLEK